MKKNDRLILVDALRGFALLGITLIHFVEHFELFHEPTSPLFFSAKTDEWVMEQAFFLISGKAYSIFALMFGFSFYIQMSRNELRGIDFRGKFLWRLTILFVIGFLHSLVYKGDILHIYALLGLPLILMYRVNIKYLVVLAILLAIQIPLIYHLINALVDPQYVYDQSIGDGYWAIGNKIYSEQGFLEVAKYNLWKGRISVWGWMIYNGRGLQLIALFIVGLVIGRQKYFENYRQYVKPFTIILLICVSLTILFNIIDKNIESFGLNEVQQNLLKTLNNSYSNLTATSSIVMTFVLAYYFLKENFIFFSFSSFGRMSLTNYVFQAVIGVILFYNFGFSLYHYFGSTLSVIFGMLFFCMQVYFSITWLKYFRYGPLEWVWRACTYLDPKLKIRKEKR